MNYRKTIGSQFFRLIIPIIFSFILLITFPASAQEGTLKWSIDIGVKGGGISSPVVGADGTIYIESGGDLYAINFDGTQKWVLAGAGTPQVIGDDGTIYAGSLHAINPDGTQKWEFIGVGDPQSIGADGTIYTIESSDEQPSLYAINPDGTQKWVSHPPSLSDDPLERRFSDAIVGADGTIYLVGLEEHWFFTSYCQCGLFAINSDGTQKWIVEGESAGGGQCIVRAPAIGYDGTIYATMGAWGMGLFAVNPDGTLKWMYVGGGASSSPTIGVDGTIYLIEMSSDGPGVPGYLSAVNPNGTRKWTGEAKALNVAPATGDDGTIYAGPGGTATMYAVNPDGTTKWQLNLCGGGSELAIGADGTIYAGFSDCDGQPSLKAINSSSTGLANSSWPMFMHDARHTGRATKAVKENLSYIPVTPCRIVDTRKTSAGIIGASTSRDFHVFGDSGTISAQGGNSAGCPAPSGEPLAAHINIVVANPTGKGNMQAFAVGGESGANLGVNFADIGSNRANAGIVETTLGSGPDITVTSRYSSAHAVIDVLGYYYPNGDLLYTPVTPCRIVDTRKAGGIIGVYTERDFHVYGDGAAISAQGGNISGCPAPMDDPLAAHINLVAVCPSGKGNMQAYPVSGRPGANLGVNFADIGTNFANAGIVQTATGSGSDITVTSRYSTAHTVIDVLGYYYPNGDFTYTPVAPCRIVDTRKTSAGMIGAYKERDFHVFGDGATIGAQGGNSTGCPVPAGEPLAAHINLVVADPTGKGNMQAYPVGGAPGANLGVNFAAIGTNFANAGTVQTATGSGPEITLTSRFSSAHAVIDVLGYYYPAP